VQTHTTERNALTGPGTPAGGRERATFGARATEGSRPTSAVASPGAARAASGFAGSVSGSGGSPGSGAAEHGHAGAAAHSGQQPSAVQAGPGPAGSGHAAIAPRNGCNSSNRASIQR